MKVFIKKVNNGWFVKSHTGHPEDPVDEAVFEYEREELEQEKLLDVLYHISENLGAEWGKYAKKQIKMFLTTGSDYEGEISEDHHKNMLDVLCDLLGKLEDRPLPETDSWFNRQAVEAALKAYKENRGY